ncbi:hypothetical protein BC829DRAFT_399296 [Chytridium lagenaria]|nr:hypothetical protein BC829DRAFT_399296 [Chytridium lagenaria]
MDKQSYQPGEEITVTMAGPDFKGFLMYFAPSDDPKKRVGTFTVPDKMQQLGPDCRTKGLTVEADNSVITHTRQQGTYTGNMQIKFKAPAAGGADLNLNVIVVQRDTATGFTSYVYKDVAAIKGPGGGSAGAAPVAAPAPGAPGVCPAASTSTCMVTKTVKNTKTQIQTVTVTATKTQTQQRKCTMKVTPGAAPGPGPKDSVTPGADPSLGVGGTGQAGQKLFTGKFVTMTCPQNQPSYTISAPPLCVSPATPAPAVAAAVAQPKNNVLPVPAYAPGVKKHNKAHVYNSGLGI